HQYYRELFRKEPSEIKVLLITSETTEINKFITRNWHKAFLELEYNTELMIEKRPFERTTNHNICQVLHEFKPDIAFMINWPASAMIEKGETRKNILWINRYRDTVNNELHHASPGYEYNNMFILPVLFEWADELKEIGIPEKRIFNTSDGVDISIFAKKEKIIRQYACDIVSVNNAVGSESFRIDFYLRSIKNEAYKKVIIKIVDELKGTFTDETLVFCLPNSHYFIEKINEKLIEHGGNLSSDGKIHLNNFFLHLMDSLCRGRIMEWIVDSGITSDINLWGKGWSNIDKFKKFHRGIARHGQELSSIYRGANISISDNPWALHERNYEVFASGGFPLIRHVNLPDIENANKITNYFRENDDVVLFYSKDDLLNKIQYYLDNPEERDRIAENGRQVVINKFSHIAITRKTMDFIKDYYKD
ncbi:MAG: glycosyltransferase, partial [Nitrospirota bacterium]|nr:glycosyltransferase [Nitrospirota bacterium]